MAVSGEGAPTSTPHERKRKRPRMDGADADTKSLEKLASGNESAGTSKELRKRMKKYIRGPAAVVKKIVNKRLKGTLKFREHLFGEAALTAAKAEQWLLPSEGGFLEAEGVERTANAKQEDIVAELGLGIGRSAFDLKLPELGPYTMDYTRNGRFLLLGGEKGHLALMDWRRSQLVAEIQVKEKVRDVQFLHSEMFFAAAQKKYVYIYDKRGMEVHCLKEHRDVLRMEFLPHHFLLATVGKAGLLQYVDTSTGQIVAQLRTKRGRCSVMESNPRNAVLHLGHSNGTVTLWSPNLTAPLVSLLCHRGPITGLAVDFAGNHMVTAGLDGQLKVWDVRTYKEVHAYFTPSPAKTVALSQRGLLAIAHGSGVQIWKDALSAKQKAPYMTHRVAGSAEIEGLGFCPYEDVLGIGHAQGFSSIMVPGAGEPNFDSLVANPFQTRKQRREGEVHSLLDKLQPDMIVLDPQAIGTVQRAARETQAHAAKKEAEANAAVRKGGAEEKTKKKTKGRNKASKRHRKKQENIVEAKKPTMRVELKKQKKPQMRAEGQKRTGPGGDREGGALARFAKKRTTLS